MTEPVHQSTTSEDSRPLSLTDREVVALYIMLKPKEMSLDSTMISLLERLESTMFESLSIEQVESIDQVYQEMTARGVGFRELSR